jgi:hypothetical protein
MAMTFSTDVSWGRNLLAPLHLYPKILPKKRVDRAPWPLFRTVAELKVLAPTNAGLLTRAYGYAELKFEPRFDPSPCFRKFPDGTRQFTGGSVSFSLGVSIYLHHWFDIHANPHKLKPDDLKLGFSIAMSHELDHLVDAYEVLDHQLPDLLSSQSDTAKLPEAMRKTVKFLRQLLLDGGNGQPARLADVDYEGWFTPRPIYETEDGRIVNRFEHSLIDLFNDRYTTLMEATDSDARHKKVEKALNSIIGGTAQFVTWP